MDKATFEKGREIRSAVLGKEFVDAAFKAADDFNMPMQELVTEYCWGAVWGREGLDKQDAQHAQPRDDQLPQPPARAPAAHRRRAQERGVPRRDPRDFMQVAIYAGVPAGVDSFRAAKEVFEKIDAK